MGTSSLAAPTASATHPGPATPQSTERTTAPGSATSSRRGQRLNLEVIEIQDDADSHSDHVPDQPMAGSQTSGSGTAPASEGMQTGQSQSTPGSQHSQHDLGTPLQDEPSNDLNQYIQNADGSFTNIITREIFRGSFENGSSINTTSSIYASTPYVHGPTTHAAPMNITDPAAISTIVPIPTTTITRPAGSSQTMVSEQHQAMLMGETFLDREMCETADVSPTSQGRPAVKAKGTSAPTADDSVIYVKTMLAKQGHASQLPPGSIKTEKKQEQRRRGSESRDSSSQGQHSSPTSQGQRDRSKSRPRNGAGKIAPRDLSAEKKRKHEEVIDRPKKVKPASRDDKSDRSGGPRAQHTTMAVHQVALQPGTSRAGAGRGKPSNYTQWYRPRQHSDRDDLDQTTGGSGDEDTGNTSVLEQLLQTPYTKAQLKLWGQQLNVLQQAHYVRYKQPAASFKRPQPSPHRTQTTGSKIIVKLPTLTPDSTVTPSRQAKLDAENRIRQQVDSDPDGSLNTSSDRDYVPHDDSGQITPPARPLPKTRTPLAPVLVGED